MLGIYNTKLAIFNEMPIDIGDRRLEQISEYRYTRMWIHNNIKWTYHDIDKYVSKDI